MPAFSVLPAIGFRPLLVRRGVALLAQELLQSQLYAGAQALPAIFQAEVPAEGVNFLRVLRPLPSPLERVQVRRRSSALCPRFTRGSAPRARTSSQSLW